ncbi:Glycosyl transferase family 2 [Novosphingobium sp. CF614]|uniref:glycosyltransferase family 2 protein n=1 Tax=Novosphingobium sp. CF614 TaxID=1884364 RepID=UPI0008E6CD2C|nr:glycosyltransferase [Novosphingobium sp. CF614]SFG35222.1 Glycosyl transferase family 2 [Novosphingobium sp. CF614]
MPKPAISVAMSVYNGERFLVSAIESVLAQDFGDFEFLILDDGSTDESPQIVRRHAAADSRIRPILRENRGLIASLNEMIDAAQAPIIARMDADDISRPDRFTKQIAFLADHPDYGVVGSWSEDIGENGQSLARGGADHPLVHEDLLLAIETGGQLICHPAAMYRRDVVLAVGGYHAAFRHCEDLDLWLRLASVTKLGNIPERLLRYRRYPGQVSSRYTTEQQIGTAVAQAAWRERRAGRPDPTATLDRLPPIDELDALFGRPGISRQVREQVALGLRYSASAMRDDGFELLMSHLRDGGRRDGMWRTVVRLLRFGEPLRAFRLAATLAANLLV